MRNFKWFAVLIVACIMTVVFVSCSNSSSNYFSNGSNSSPGTEVLCKYEGYPSTAHGAKDIIIIYDDNTWEEKCLGTIYTKGYYKINQGNEINGTIYLEVTYSQLSYLPKGTKKTVTISNGSFYFNDTKYTKK